MDYPILKRGDKGDAVKRLQAELNKVGAMLVPDGDFGSGTELGVFYAKDIAGQPPSGTADDSLWTWLSTQPEPFPPLPINGVAFIAKEETGGLRYYESVTRWPHYPGEISGITIGVGYDLRFHSEADFRKNWSALLPQATIDELAKDIGRKGTKTRAAALKKQKIEVSFKFAWQVFIKNTLPRHYTSTESIYPSLPRLPLLCDSALVSIVFNRGTDLKGPRRSEMRTIRDILMKADDASLSKSERKVILTAVEDEILSMQRLWSPGSGLIKRRQSEANLWREGLESW